MSKRRGPSGTQAAPSGPQAYTLRDADRPYRIIVERMQEGALTLTPAGVILYANQRLASFLGLAMGNIVGQKFGRFIAASDQDRFDALLADGDAGSGRGELVLHAADGMVVPVYLSMVDLPDEDQRIIVVIVADLRWQKQRIQEPSVGGSLGLFQARTHDASMKRRLEASQRAVERGERITEQLLAFSRIQTLRPRSTSVNALLRDLAPCCAVRSATPSWSRSC